MNIKYYKIAVIAMLLLISACEEKPYAILGNNYFVEYDEFGGLMIVKYQYKIIIQEFVINYKYDSNNIVVKQKPLGKIDSMFNLDKIDRYNKRMQAFDMINYFDYWIINKQNDSLYGPFQKTEYLLKMKELNIPDSMRVDR